MGSYTAIAFLFHVAIAACDWTGWGIVVAIGISPKYHFGQWACFLTLWGQFTQAIFFTFSALIDLLYMSGNPRVRHMADFLRRHRDRYFTMCFGLANVIGTVFWLVLFPHAFKEILDNDFYLNFMAHGVTWVAVWIELFMSYHKYGSKILELVLLLGFGGAYMGWTQIAYAHNHVWPYFFMDKLTDVEYWVITAVIALYAVIMYFVGRAVSHFYWKRRADYTGQGNTAMMGMHVLHHGDPMTVNRQTVEWGNYGTLVEP
jgi:hypothetical protein